MSNSVATSEVLDFAVESPTGHLGYVDGFFLDERSWKIPSIRLSVDSSLIKKHPIVPQSQIERIDVSSRRIFLKSELELSDSPTPVSYLHTTHDLIRFEIHTPERSFGRVEDLIFNTITWEIENLVVYTHKLFGGRHILLQPRQIKRIAWNEKKLDTSLSAPEVENQPEFKPSNPIFQVTHWFG